MAKPIKRITPVDDPSLKLLWIEKHRYNTEELGLSNRQSFYLISDEYGCACSTVRYWCDENDRTRTLQHQKETRIPYLKSRPALRNYRKAHSQTYLDIRRNPDIYLDEITSGVATPMSLDEITIKLHELTGILMRNKTFLKCIRKYEKEHDVQILEQVEGYDPPAYHAV